MASTPAERTTTGLVAAFGLGLLCLGALRYSAAHPNPLTPLAGFATPGYVLVTVVFSVLLMHRGLPLHRLGFGERPGLRLMLLGVAALAARRALAAALDPTIEGLLGARDLGRFARVEGSAGTLALLLLLNWTLAAFGEELAYRIVLMRGIAFALGDGRAARAGAVALQAVLFGLVHAYQGPAGVAGAAISGLVFGAVTLAARWSIWPAALAHGANNTLGILELYGGR